MSDSRKTQAELVAEVARLRREVAQLKKAAVAREQAGDAIRDRERELQAILDNMASGLLIADAETRQFLLANPAVCRMFGYSMEEMLALPVEDIHPRESVTRALEEFAELKAGKHPVAADIPCLRKDGTVFLADIASAQMTYRGRVCLLGIFRDVTERKRPDKALRESEARYRAVVESQTELICRFVPESTLTFVNEAYCRYFGKGREELVGQSFLPLIPPKDRAAVVRRFAPVTPETPVVDHEHRVVMPSGEVRWMHWVNRGFFDEQGRLVEFQASGYDVTERKRAEESLRQSEEKYRTLFEQSLDGVAVLVDGRVVGANRAAAGIYRMELADAMGRHISEFLHPDDVADAVQQIRTVVEGREDAPTDLRYRARRSDGTYALVEVLGKRIEWEGKPAVQVILRDVTERARLEEELREAHKMEAIGQLAGGIAHDFNNLVTGILCHANLIKSDARVPKEALESADIIEAAARRAADLTSQLLGFARGGKHQDIPVDLNVTVETVIRLVSGTLDPRVRIVTHLEPGGAWAQGDPVQMEQVVLNLAMNARDAMPEGGELAFRTGVAEVDEKASAGVPHARPGRYVVLCVCDTGCGIAEDVRSHIFEPFFTTKEPGRGVGMGLAMVYGIARNHGGWVEVESRPGHGATFRVLWPVAGSRAAAAAVPTAEPIAPPTGHILLVEDERLVRDAVVRMLTALGYSVVGVENGREAVEYYARYGGSVDLVIIDMIMPEMDGRECFRALRRLNPDLKAVLSTGWGGDGATQETLDEGMVGFVRKPYQAEQLAEVVRRALVG